MVDDLDAGVRAKLFRATGEKDKPGRPTMVIEADLRRAVAIALEDRDLWRFTITTPGRPTIKPDQILKLGEHLAV